MMSATPASEIAETAFNEIRYIFLHCQDDTPDRTARLLHLFRTAALAEYTAQMERYPFQRTWETLDGSPPPAAKRSKSCGSYEEPPPLATGAHFEFTSNPLAEGAEPGPALPSMAFGPGDCDMSDMLAQVTVDQQNLASGSSVPLDAAVQVHADSPGLRQPPRPIIPLHTYAPSEYSAPTLPPATPVHHSAMTTQPQPQPQPEFQPLPHAQPQPQLQALTPQVEQVANSVIKPNQFSDEFFIPQEDRQVVLLQRGSRPGAQWFFWQHDRLVNVVCRPEAPEGYVSMLLKKNDAVLKEHWEPIAHDYFFDSRTATALQTQLQDLKKLYVNCLMYQQFAGDKADGVQRGAAYDRSLPESTLLNTIEQRIMLIQSQGQSLGNLTSRIYLKWTYDEQNGIFARMSRQLGQTLPAARTSAPRGDNVYPRGSSNSSRVPDPDVVNFAAPRNPAPAIPDEDDDLVKTPTSSIGPRSSAPASNHGRSNMSSHRAGSTQPTSLRSGFPQPQNKSVANEQHAEVPRMPIAPEQPQPHLPLGEHPAADGAQIGNQVPTVYDTACAIVNSYYRMCRQAEYDHVEFAGRMSNANMGAASAVALQLVQNFFSQLPPPVPFEEYERLVEKKRKELLKAQHEELQPDDSASAGGWLNSSNSSGWAPGSSGSSYHFPSK